MVNSLHSRLKSFVGRFNGVSQPQAPALPRLVLLARAVPLPARGTRAELLYGHEANGRYVCTRQLTHSSRPAHP